MAATELRLLIDTVSHEHNAVLQFDPERRILRSWLWPKDDSGALVTPENLRKHRTSYAFLGPCCFCPELTSDGSAEFVEAAMLKQGNMGFVARCPTDRCGYLVCLGRIFEGGNMPTAAYPRRGDDEKEPPPVYHHSEDKDNVFAKTSFNSCELYGARTALPSLPPTHQVLPRPVQYSNLLRKLDSKVRPGIPEEAMKKLFVRCRNCNMVTTRRAFLYHACFASDHL